MILFWYFLIYSFLGFLLEVAYAALTGGHPRRKCQLLLPLCPVYGLGACTVLALSQNITGLPQLLLAGMAGATFWEYVMAVYYEEGLGVSFWDYSDLPFNFQGRICLPFSLAWGLLSVPLVRWLHPALEALLPLPPAPVTLGVFLLWGADWMVSSLLLYRSGTRDSLYPQKK